MIWMEKKTWHIRINLQYLKFLRVYSKSGLWWKVSTFGAKSLLKKTVNQRIKQRDRTCFLVWNNFEFILQKRSFKMHLRLARLSHKNWCRVFVFVKFQIFLDQFIDYQVFITNWWLCAWTLIQNTEHFCSDLGFDFV